jgi:hypothetical protein
MKNEERHSYVTRNVILRLLSDDEVARVSTAEARTAVPADAEYVDLENLQRGVQKVGASQVVMSQIIPRSAVSSGTWDQIIARLDAHAPPARA